jgi:MFS family permease
MVAYVFSYIDRQILTLMIEPIRTDLALSDTQFGLLHGLAFALFYATMGVPIAHLSDRHSRPLIVGAGVFVWSLATAACGMARTFGQLFTSRLFVGVGEGALSPATYSMLADYFPREQLGRAVAVYSIGSFIGAGLAYIGGGALVSSLAQIDAANVSVLGATRPWQLTFIMVGLPGIAVAIVCWLTVRDAPRRSDGAAAFADAAAAASARDVIGFCRTHAAAIGCHFVGFSFASLALYQLLAWAPAILMRRHSLTAGWVNDWLRQHGRLDAPMATGAIGGAGVVIPSLLLPWADTVAAAIAVLGVAFFFAAFPMPPSTAAIQLLAPNRMRSRIAAMFLFCNSLVGMAVGSVVVGALNDRVFTTASGVASSVAIVAAAAGVATVVVLGAGMRPFRESLARQQRASVDAGRVRHSLRHARVH